MTIHLPNDLEGRIRAAVHGGRFASVNDAMAEAARLLLRELDRGPQARPPGDANDPGPDPFLGSLTPHDELDEIVADVYRRRREETWRDVAVE